MGKIRSELIFPDEESVNFEIFWSQKIPKYFLGAAEFEAMNRWIPCLTGSKITKNIFDQKSIRRGLCVVPALEGPLKCSNGRGYGNQVVNLFFENIGNLQNIWREFLEVMEN